MSAHRPDGPTLAEQLGRFAADTPMESFPALALERAKMIVASTLASASRGVDIASTRALLAAEVRLGSSGPCGLWFGAGTLAPDRAARMNAVASDAAASDDSDLRSIAHIGTPTTAAGLAVAQWRARSGRELLVAMVMGYEIAGRVDEALTPGRMQRGFHGSVSTIFGATVTAGRLLRLDAQKMTHALSLAASSACGMAIAADTSCAREYHAGLAAMLGVQAAVAAESGFESESAVLESPRGFFDAMNGQAVEQVAEGLGTSWDIVTDMAIKLMPGAHPFHAIAQAAIELAVAHDLKPEQVASATISAPQLQVWAHQAVPPHDPPPHPDRFGHRHGGTVAVTTTDGRLLRHTCKAPRGSGTTGIEWADVEDKYRALVPRAECSGDRVEQSLALIRKLEDQASVDSLIKLIRPVLA